MSSRRRFGKVRKLPSARYQASYLDPRTGKRVFAPATFKTKTDADRWLVDIEARLQRDDLPDLALGRTTFEEWANRWLSTRQIKPKTAVRYESTVRGHLIPYFGQLRINAVTRADVVDFVVHMTDAGKAEGTVEGARRILSSIFTEAVHSGAITKNPTAGVRVRRSRREEMIFLNRRQVTELSNAISRRPIRRRGGHVDFVPSPEYGLLVRFTAETGLRSGEVAALRVGRVDVDRCRVEVAESVAEVSVKHAPGGLAYGEPKTYERRSVPIPASLAQDLREHLNTRPNDPKTFVFVSPTGKPLRHSNFYDRIYKPAVLRAELPEGLRFHDLRHTYAALLIAAEANTLTVKQRMGHSSITVTMDRYGHLFPHLEEAITDRMDDGYRMANQINVNGLGLARGSNEPEAEVS